jgi:hypothetical protein
MSCGPIPLGSPSLSRRVSSELDLICCTLFLMRIFPKKNRNTHLLKRWYCLDPAAREYFWAMVLLLDSNQCTFNAPNTYILDSTSTAKIYADVI